MGGFSEKGEPDAWDMAVGHVIGYRWWKIAVPATLAGFADYRADTPAWEPRQDPLSGANMQHWHAGKNTAVCTRSSAVPTWAHLLEGTLPMDHEPPEYREPCGCGFWAYFNPFLDVDRVLGGVSGDNPSRAGNQVFLPVLGVVKGTGRVIIGQKGFRSQYAEIIGLCVSDRAKRHLNWNIRVSPPDEHYYERQQAQTYSYAWQTAPGSMEWRRFPSSYEVITQADDADRLIRYAAVEALLSTAYPDARIMCDENALRSYFGTDKNYYDPSTSW